jgi:DNA-binding response OmpR family regulator
MKTRSFLPRSPLQRRVAKAVTAPQFDVETTVSAEQCLQFAKVTLYDAVLVDADFLNFGEVVTLVKILRQTNSDAALFVLARSLDLEQRLRLFEAGVDDCVREPFFASELAVRLGLSIGLRQAASDLAASKACYVHIAQIVTKQTRRRSPGTITWRIS